MEIYKDIEGYKGYKISNYGNVKSLKFGKEKILKQTKNKKGYLYVCLYKDGKVKHYKVHRLVAQTFIPNTNNYQQVNHKDEDKQNNHVTNLEWCTSEYNNNYGTHNKRSALSRSKQVMCIETGKIYSSTNEVERQLGFAHQYISQCCNGKYKQAYGYTWKYVS